MFGKKKETEEAPVQISPTEWLNEVLKEAVVERASDIHIVPHEDRMSASFRIDGVMQLVDEWDIENHDHVISRIKVLAGVDVVEKQVPQDGHIEILLNWPKKKKAKQNLENTEVKKVPVQTQTEEKNDEKKGGEDDISKKTEETAEDTKEDDREVLANFRVSLMPTIHGETAVLRALNRSENLLDIEKLGFSKKVLPVIVAMIRRSQGMVLLTGPTGSGKTTTLYSILNKIHSKEATVLTLEDPVEYSLRGIRQTQVQPDVGDYGVSWSTGLKASLRQDPDILMVGEIRDAETAEIAVHASLAGRLVFSTFHTASVEGVLIQLIDMEIARSSIASALAGIITQRLVRKICEHCRVEAEPPLELLRLLGVEEWTHGNVHAGEGCKECNGTGYRGRIGIFEVLPMDNELRSMILKKSSFEELGPLARRKILQTLSEDGLEKVKEGVTTVEEVVRAVV